MIDKPIILVDMDDTTVMTTQYWINELYERHGVQPLPALNEYNLTKRYPTLTRDQVMAPLREPGFFTKLKPQPGALDTIRDWLMHGYDVRFASVVYKDCITGYQDKLTWIENNIPEMVGRTIVHSNHDKTLLYGTVLIDDHPKHIEDAQWATPICFAQPWNAYLMDKRLYCMTWHQVAKTVDNILNWRGLSR